jgi:lipopolysaccharide biosynthesis glycosyltransferase
MTSDEAFAMPLAVALRSMVEANRTGQLLHVFVLTSDVSISAKRKVVDSLPEGSVILSWVPVDPTPFERFRTRPHISSMTYVRLLLPDILPGSITKVLYVDPDILVLDDLAPLWQTALGDAVVGAVVDIFSEASARRLGLIDRDRRGSDCPTSAEYFNAGVLLIDLMQWRREGITEAAFEYLREHPETTLSDQDALNVACAGRWKRLDSRWNFQTHLHTSIAAIPPSKRPGIAHFVTSSKPWIASARSWNAAFYDTFRSRTRFSRSPTEKLRDFLESSWSGVKNVWRRRTVLRTLKTLPFRAAARTTSITKVAKGR